MVTKRIICLANSEKGAGHCVAGIELLDDLSIGAWIRPIGSGHEGALTHREQAYQNGTSPQLLDILNVHLLEPRPQGCQTENWQVDPGFWWEKVGECAAADIDEYAENPEALFVNAGHTFKGVNDQIPEEIAALHPRSLHLIRLPALQVQVTAGFEGNPPEIRAQFIHGGTLYRLKITDPVVKNEFLPQGLGQYDLGACLACISLALPFQKNDGNLYRFKVVAGIMRL
ncbi:dual OB domain-containing protein [Caballeronia cordobensis]|uniref:dual OB domain-containing protein n=1 Tax=Caballeronia cordobensis TaxID=1353886 RepID=UPI00045EEF69|nr:putative membrane protein [Burkholderia sp. RPE67]